MNKININEQDDIEKVLAAFPPGEHSWFEVKGNREIDLTLPSFNSGWQNDLSKAISAMANSGGGYLLLGAIESQSNILLDGKGINQKVKNNGTRKWLEDTLYKLTDPFLQRIDVFELTNFQGNQLAGTALYIVEIDESPIAPHQAKDNKYYIRIGSSSLAATHQMVMDIMNRKQHPEMKLSFSYGFVDILNPNHIKREGPAPVLIIDIENIGKIYAQYMNVILKVPKYLVDLSYASNEDLPIVEEDNLKYLQIVRENVITEIESTDNEIISRIPGRYAPILPGRNHAFCIPLIGNFEDHCYNFRENRPVIIWELYADNMPLQEGRYSLDQIRVNAKLPLK